MKKIKIISCYFGSLPKHFELWCESCYKNKNYDFMLVTDQKVFSEKNLEIKKMSFNEFKTLINKKLKPIIGFNISMDGPYKVCDYRPAFGIIFEDELNGYDFWGYCDLDMIFGDFNKFLSQDLFERFERIGMNGHLSFCKNNKKINNLFKLSGAEYSYKKVFKDSYSYIFDEMRGLNKICEKNEIKFYKNLKFLDCSTKTSRLALNKNLYTPEVFIYKNGGVYNFYLDGDEIKSEEFLYIHFSGKNIPLKGDLNTKKTLIIYSDKIINVNKELNNKEIIKEYSEFANKYTETLLLVKGILKKIEKIFLKGKAKQLVILYLKPLWYKY
ncbi:MAG: DUF6625 family protein [Psychrilyobacter sp.]|uniref:DUF6625 family protein n=1 Tax=Psychrilyobacter sp. TaxID=2586924 RepID=UPI003C711658